MFMLMLTLAPGSCGARVSGSKEFLMEVYKENVSGSLLLAGLLTLASFPPLGIGLAAREAELEALPRPGLHVSAVSRQASPHSLASTEVRPWIRPFLADSVRQQRGASGF